MKLLSTLFVSLLLAVQAQAFPRGGGAPINASPSANTIYVPFGSSSSANALSCGISPGTFTIAAVDNGVNSASRIVAGLTPSTLYYCNASGILFTLATLALPATTPIISVTWGTPAQPVAGQTKGDTFYNVVSNDNVTYLIGDDTTGFSAGAFVNLQIGDFTTESPLTGADINRMSGFSPGPSCFGTVALSPKLSGLTSIGGNLYAALGWQYNTNCANYPAAFGPFGAQTSGIFPQSYGSIIKSTDKGLTWANFQNPSTFNANGSPPSPNSTLFFSSALEFGAPHFIMYGADDGTLGYRVDDADAYVYLISNDVGFDNGSNLYLARIPKAKLVNLNASDVQYFTGGDGNLASNWSSSSASQSAIYTSAGKVGYSSIQYWPSINRYILFTWYYPAPGTPANSHFVTLEGSHPWGPWTQIDDTTWSGSGYYNPVALQRSALTATPNGTPFTVLFSGDYTTNGSSCSGAGKYCLWSALMTAHTH